MHVSESSIPEGSGLRVAPAGVENTIRLHMEVSPHAKAIALLELICSVGILRDISVDQVQQYDVWARMVPPFPLFAPWRSAFGNPRMFLFHVRIPFVSIVQVPRRCLRPPLL